MANFIECYAFPTDSISFWCQCDICLGLVWSGLVRTKFLVAVVAVNCQNHFGISGISSSKSKYLWSSTGATTFRKSFFSTGNSFCTLLEHVLPMTLFANNLCWESKIDKKITKSFKQSWHVRLMWTSHTDLFYVWKSDFLQNMI